MDLSGIDSNMYGERLLKQEDGPALSSSAMYLRLGQAVGLLACGVLGVAMAT